MSRLTFGVVIDLVGTNVSEKDTARKARLSEIRTAARQSGYVGFNSLTQQEAARYSENGWAVNMKSIQSKILRNAKRLVVITQTYKAVKAQVATALYAGTPVWVYSLYKTPDEVHPTTVEEWYALCNDEHQEHIAFAKQMSYNQNMVDLHNDLVAVLNTPVKWLGYNYLHQLVAKFQSFEHFMLYVEGTIADIKDEGEWDTERSVSFVPNIKASTYVDKDRELTATTRSFDLWNNYEELPADIIKEFLSLTFYKAAGIKPLKRVLTNGSDFTIHNGDDSFHSTPLYVTEE